MYFDPDSKEDVMTHATTIKCGDLVTFKMKNAKGTLVERIGIVTTVNTNQSEHSNTMGYGSIGVVACVSEQSDAVYFIFGAETVGKPDYEFKFYSY